MADDRVLADRKAEIALSDPERFAEGFFGYERYRLTVEGAQQTREVVRAGRVAAVLPIDVARDEIVLIRQFRLPAHLANGHGELVEIVAGRVEQGEQPAETARRECAEEIGVAPAALVELFSYLTTPGLTDEQVTVFLAAVDASSVPERTHATEGERISVMRAPIDTALSALTESTVHNGPLVIALQWLALNRGRVADLLRAGHGSG
ncbi:MAG: NUDIX hydrolase [Pseudolabrys sp.]|jgi:ADP-ribose pyrophosphatase